MSTHLDSRAQRAIPFVTALLAVPFVPSSADSAPATSAHGAQDIWHYSTVV